MPVATSERCLKASESGGASGASTADARLLTEEIAAFYEWTVRRLHAAGIKTEVCVCNSPPGQCMNVSLSPVCVT